MAPSEEVDLTTPLTSSSVAAKMKLGESDFNFFPDLPPYSDPMSGFVSKLPSAWIPYAQLMRLEKPAGFYAFYFPHLIGLVYAACIASSAPEPSKLVYLSIWLIPYNVLLRGVACTWNDTVDQQFDRRVRRSRHRPIARGAVSTWQAHSFALAQLLLGLYPLLRWPGSSGGPFPRACMPHALIALALFTIYALLKRVTYYPQVFLGVAFAWAVPFCVAALVPGDVEQVVATWSLPTAALCGANVLWTVVYDTIYAHQDIEDDAKAGVKGMALRFRNSTKLLASVLIIALVGLLTMCGMWARFGTTYFAATVGGVTAAMGYFIWDVDLNNPESCGLWFHRQFWLVGFGFLAGLVGEYGGRLIHLA